MKLFWKALSDKLIADSSLVSLTGHTSSDPRIILYQPEGMPEYPCLCFKVKGSEDWVKGFTEFKRTDVTFLSFAKDLIICDNIITRVNELLEQKGVNFYDKYFDISNSDIVNHWTRFLNRYPIEYDEEKQVYVGVINAQFDWHEA